MYIDSSVLLRVTLGEREALPAWRKITKAVSSEIIRLECLRTIDRARIRLRLADSDVSLRRTTILEHLEGFDLVRVDRAVLERATDPFPTALGSLDAIHLASALLLRPALPDLRFATHDEDLAVAARSVGFEVLGVGRRRRARKP
jgi:hypothetical protein